MQYSDSLKNSFVSMMVSNDLGARFYDEKARPFFVKMINHLTETSKFPLAKLPIITDNSTSFIALSIRIMRPKKENSLSIGTNF